MERVNRTLKSKLYCYFTAVNSLRYIDVLQDLVYSYDNTYHRSIGPAPATNATNNLILNFTQETLQHSRIELQLYTKEAQHPLK